MFDPISALTSLLNAIGAPAAIAYVVLFAVRHFNKAERQTYIDLWEGVKDTFTNIPRRWKSEVARAALVYEQALATIRSSTADETEKDRAERKEAMTLAKIEVKAVGRAVAGIVEDTWNVTVDLVFVLVPLAAGIIAAWRQGAPTLRGQ